MLRLVQIPGGLWPDIENEVEDADTMLERGKELWILAIACVIHPPHVNACVCEQALIQVGAGRGPRQVARGVNLSAEFDQPFGPPVWKVILRGPVDGRSDLEALTNRGQEPEVNPTQR